MIKPHNTTLNDDELSDNELSDDELALYARQILLDEWGLKAQLRLKHANVLVVGVGGLGCPALETLVRAGVGHLLLIDDDKVQLSNLQRQSLFYPDDIGKPKAQTACLTLKKTNPYVEIHAICQRLDDGLAHQLFAHSATHADNRFDVILDCSDNFATRRLLNQLSVKHNIPLLSASAIAMNGQLALFEPAKNTGCYHCIFGHTTPIEQTCATSGVLASTPAFMGQLQANVALQFLGRGINPLANKLLLCDGQRMKIQAISYHKQASCDVCGGVGGDVPL